MDFAVIETNPIITNRAPLNDDDDVLIGPNIDYLEIQKVDVYGFVDDKQIFHKKTELEQNNTFK